MTRPDAGMEEVGLEQMLAAREKRVERHRELIGKYGMPLVSFTINMPGKYKKTPASGVAFAEGCRELLRRLHENGTPPVYQEMHGLATGYEAYFAVNEEGFKLKELGLQIEQGHPLGRLFDLDIIGRDGAGISREQLNHSGRKCLLCGRDAHVCARSRAHGMEELLKKIQDMVEAYRSQKAAGNGEVVVWRPE